MQQPPYQPEDTWQEWSRHVLAELKRLNENIQGLEVKLDTIRVGLDDKLDKVRGDFEDKLNTIQQDQITPLKVQIAMLQVKSGVWGLIGGAIPVILMILIEFMKK